MARAQTFTHEADSRGLRIVDRDHTPSWVANGNGWAELQVYADPNRGWVSLWATECNMKGRTFSKTTHLTLDAEAAQALLTYLQEKIGEQAGGVTRPYEKTVGE